MPKKYRLSRIDFQSMRTFKRIVGDYFSLSYGTLPGRTSQGAACVVSSKAAARAADRNKIKRRCRAVVSEYLKKSSGPTIIFYAKKGAAKASSVDIKKDIEQLLSKI